MSNICFLKIIALNKNHYLLKVIKRDFFKRKLYRIILWLYKKIIIIGEKNPLDGSKGVGECWKYWDFQQVNR